MHIPRRPYVALYGSHAGDWRSPLVARFERENIGWFDPTQDGWSLVDSSNGDGLQGLIDGLVAHEHEGLRRAACVVFYVAKRKRVGGCDTGETTMSLASRCEFGWLIARATPTFFYVEPDVDGRNYLKAAALSSPAMHRCDSLDEALDRAVGFMRALTDGRSASERDSVA